MTLYIPSLSQIDSGLSAGSCLPKVWPRSLAEREVKCRGHEPETAGPETACRNCTPLFEKVSNVPTYFQCDLTVWFEIKVTPTMRPARSLFS